jgi:hypothetical protein
MISLLDNASPPSAVLSATSTIITAIVFLATPIATNIIQVFIRKYDDHKKLIRDINLVKDELSDIIKILNEKEILRVLPTIRGDRLVYSDSLIDYGAETEKMRLIYGDIQTYNNYLRDYGYRANMYAEFLSWGQNESIPGEKIPGEKDRIRKLYNKVKSKGAALSDQLRMFLEEKRIKNIPKKATIWTFILMMCRLE